MTIHRKFGWKPDRPDHRDFKFRATRKLILPEKVDLRPKFPVPVYDQGELGSCTSQAIAAALQYIRIQQKETPDFIPSRLFIYYNERADEGTIDSDEGAFIRSGIKAVTKVGFCDEALWPYVEKKFKDKPSEDCYVQAKQYHSIEYYRINNKNLDLLKNCLASGFPFVFGITLYSNFYDGDTDGMVPMPQGSEDGGHCIICVGYDDKLQRFCIRNSWGTACGDNGHYWLPYKYVTNTDLADDFWTLRKTAETDGK